MAAEWHYQKWQGKPKPKLNSKSSSLGGALNNEEEVDWREIYGPSFGYGDLGYDKLVYGPSLSEMRRSLKPTGTRRGVNWDRVTATLGVGQNGKANEDKPAVGMPQKQKPVPDATTEAFSAIPTSSDDTLQQQNAHSNLSAYQANPPNVNEARHIGTQKNQKSDRQPTESQSAQSLTLVERFRERLTRKALRQLYENELHILRTQSKYQEDSRQNPADKEAALERLRQVVAADERLKSTQELLKIRQRTNPEFWRDKNGAPVLKNPRSRQALIDQNNAKLDEIDRVRYTLLQLVRYHNISGWVPGDWTDDTDQMLCILDSLLEQQVDLLDIVRRFHHWAITDGMGRGQTVYSVVHSPDFLQNPHAVAKRIWEASERKAAASGGMMRTSVLGIWKYNSPVKVRRNAEQVCQITHYDPRCVGSCVTVSLAIAGSHAWWRN